MRVPTLVSKAKSCATRQPVFPCQASHKASCKRILERFSKDNNPREHLSVLKFPFRAVTLDCRVELKVQPRSLRAGSGETVGTLCDRNWPIPPTPCIDSWSHPARSVGNLGQFRKLNFTYAKERCLLVERVRRRLTSELDQSKERVARTVSWRT
jgi:hypothetical protein